MLKLKHSRKGNSQARLSGEHHFVKCSMIQGHWNHRFSNRDETSLLYHISLCVTFCRMLQVWACWKSVALKGAKSFQLRSVLVYTTCKLLEENKYLKDFAKPTFYYKMFVRKFWNTSPWTWGNFVHHRVCLFLTQVITIMSDAVMADSFPMPGEQRTYLGNNLIGEMSWQYSLATNGHASGGKMMMGIRKTLRVNGENLLTVFYDKLQKREVFYVEKNGVKRELVSMSWNVFFFTSSTTELFK